MASFTLKLKEHRVRHGLTQRKLAEKLQVHYSVISDYERGVLTPSLERAVQLALVLHVSLDDLVDYKHVHNK